MANVADSVITDAELNKWRIQAQWEDDYATLPEERGSVAASDVLRLIAEVERLRADLDSINDGLA